MLSISPELGGAIFVRLFLRFDGDTIDLSWAISVSNFGKAIATFPCAGELVAASGYCLSTNPAQNSAQPNKHCSVAFRKQVLPKFLKPQLAAGLLLSGPTASLNRRRERGFRCGFDDGGQRSGYLRAAHGAQ